MSAITGFSYTVSKRRRLDASASINQAHASLTAGDGSLTYPTGGIPFDKTQLGFNNSLEFILFTGQTTVDGYVYKYDIANAKIKLFQQSSATSALTELPNTATPQLSFNIVGQGY